jgi:hypothetical protein
MLAKATCQICNVKDDTSLMVKEENNKYSHIEKCHDQYIEKDRKTKEEFQNWCELYEYLKALHSVPDIPPRNIKRLKVDLNKGKGYGFDLILEAYKKCEENMKWFISDVIKGKCDAEGINACITHMLNKGLNLAWQDRENKRKRQEQIQKQIDKKTDDNKEIVAGNTNKTNKIDEMDISAFL